jgi:hypothetical protein
MCDAPRDGRRGSECKSRAAGRDASGDGWPAKNEWWQRQVNDLAMDKAG